MMGMRNLSTPPAPLKVSLPGSKCSPMPCLPPPEPGAIEKEAVAGCPPQRPLFLRCF